MRRFASIIFLVCVFVTRPVWSDEVEATWLKVPDGFKVTHFADDELATNIYCMTTDSKGRIVVAGPGYIKILIDEDEDGKADSAKLFSEVPRNGAMGLFFDGPDLICVGDEGLLRLRDRNKDDRADGPPEVLLRFKTGGEHDSHAIRKGPDGWWYLISGNYSGVGNTMISSSRSPVKTPLAGVITRISPDFQKREIIADGMRNAYDFDFDEQGDLFVYDSDGERDVSLPWYRPTRVYRLHPGSHAGWVSRSWKRPDYFFDMPTITASLGRGSPTGIVCYRHWQFPSRYRNATFVLDWTFGRVIAVHKKTRKDANQSFENELFVSGKGTHGFAPTDACIGVDGSLYISVGGRSTQGSVYRVQHVESVKTLPRIGAPTTLTDCLDLPQPLSAWSSALANAFAKKAGQEELEKAIFNQSLSIRHRVRAVELATANFGTLSAATLAKLTEIEQPLLQARMAWSVCLQPIGNIDSSILFHFLNHKDDSVRIATMEALTGNQNIPSFLAEPVLKCLQSKNIHLQKATAEFINSSWFDPLEHLKEDQIPAKESVPVAYWMGRQIRKTSINVDALHYSIQNLESATKPEEQLKLLRLFQIALGDVGPKQGLPQVFESYTARNSLPTDLVSSTRKTLLNLLGTESKDVLTETIRCIGMGRLGTDELATKMFEHLSSDSSPIMDIHVLAAFAQSGKAQPELRSKTVETILGIQPKIDQLELNQDRNWEPRFKEIVRQLIQSDDEVPKELVRQGISHRGQVFLFQFVDQEQKVEAIDRFIKELEKSDEFEPDSNLVRLLASTSHSAHWELIRKSFASDNVKDTVVELLARKPYEGDRGKFIAGLNSAQVKTVRLAAQSLLKLEAPGSPAEQFALLNAMNRISPDKEGYAAREWIVRVLRRNMGRSFGFVYGPSGHNPQSTAISQWSKFLAEKFPEESMKQKSKQKFDPTELAKTLFDVDWSQGDFAAGKKLYSTLSCAKCHGSRNRLGPDLAGVTKRFSKEDLFRAIADPGFQVPSRYQTTLFETEDGRYHSGIIIYDSVDGVLIRDSDNNTVRIEQSDIVRRQKIARSLMPDQLLKDLDSQGFADLYKYLESL